MLVSEVRDWGMQCMCEDIQYSRKWARDHTRAQKVHPPNNIPHHKLALMPKICLDQWQ